MGFDTIYYSISYSKNIFFSIVSVNKLELLEFSYFGCSLRDASNSGADKVQDMTVSLCLLLHSSKS